MKRFFTALLLLSASLYSQAQVIPPSWVRLSGPASYQNFNVQEVSVGTDTFGNVYTAASMLDTTDNSMQAQMTKYNAAGVMQWQLGVSGSDPNYNATDVVALLVDPSGNSYVCGYGKSNDSTGFDFLIMKLDSAGTVNWIQYWDGGHKGDDYITSASFDASGNIVVAGYTNHGAGTTGDDAAVLKMSAAGNILWSYTYNNTTGNDEDRALAVASDVNNNTYITGSTYQTKRNMLVIKLNSSGANQWTRMLPHVTANMDERGLSIVADAAGNSYATGEVGDWITIKYDAAGNALWTNHYTTHDLQQSKKKVLLDRHNNVIVAGEAFVSTAHQTDIVVNKLTSAGGTVWSTVYNENSVDEFHDAVLDTAGYIYIAASFDGPSSTDLNTMVIAPGGLVTWHTTYANTVHPTGLDMSYQIALDRHRNIILGGITENSSGTQDDIAVLTLKYAAPVLHTGIADIAASVAEMTIYPNPNQGMLIVKVTDEALIGTDITVSNMLGETIIQDKLRALTQHIDLSGASKGMYIVSIRNEKATISKKLILE